MKQVLALIGLLMITLVASVQAVPTSSGVAEKTLEGTISSYKTDATGEVVSFTFSGTVAGEPVVVLKDEEIEMPSANGNDDTIKRLANNGNTVKFKAKVSGSGSNKTYKLDGGLRVTP